MLHFNVPSTFYSIMLNTRLMRGASYLQHPNTEAANSEAPCSQKPDRLLELKSGHSTEEPCVLYSPVVSQQRQATGKEKKRTEPSLRVSPCRCSVNPLCASAARKRCVRGNRRFGCVPAPPPWFSSAALLSTPRADVTNTANPPSAIHPHLHPSPVSPG